MKKTDRAVHMKGAVIVLALMLSGCVVDGLDAAITTGDRGHRHQDNGRHEGEREHGHHQDD